MSRKLVFKYYWSIADCQLFIHFQVLSDYGSQKIKIFTNIINSFIYMRNALGRALNSNILTETNSQFLSPNGSHLDLEYSTSIRCILSITFC